MEKSRHQTGNSMLPDMSSTILSWDTLWNMGTKVLIQVQKFDTCWMSSGVTSCPQQSLQLGYTLISMRRLWCNSCLPYPVHWQESPNTECQSCLCWPDQTCQMAEDQCYMWYFQRKDWVEEVFQRRVWLSVNGTITTVVWTLEGSQTPKG